MQNMTNLDGTVDFFTRRTQGSADLTKSNGPSDFAKICRSKGSWRGAIGPASGEPAGAGAEQRHASPPVQTGRRRHPGWLAQTERVVCDEHGRVGAGDRGQNHHHAEQYGPHRDPIGFEARALVAPDLLVALGGGGPGPVPRGIALGSLAGDRDRSPAGRTGTGRVALAGVGPPLALIGNRLSPGHWYA
jgi:hypothetical protein